MGKRYLSRDNIVGKQVIDSKAMILGSVKDLSFDLETKDIGLTITTKDGKEVTISSGEMGCVGDVILLKKTLEQLEAPEVVEEIPPPQPKVVEKAPPPPPPPKPGLCAVCGYQNDPASKFCIKCGTKLG